MRVERVAPVELHIGRFVRGRLALGERVGCDALGDSVGFGLVERVGRVLDEALQRVNLGAKNGREIRIVVHRVDGLGGDVGADDGCKHCLFSYGWSPRLATGAGALLVAVQVIGEGA